MGTDGGSLRPRSPLPAQRRHQLHATGVMAESYTRLHRSEPLSLWSSRQVWARALYFVICCPLPLGSLHEAENKFTTVKGLFTGVCTDLLTSCRRQKQACGSRRFFLKNPPAFAGSSGSLTLYLMVLAIFPMFLTSLDGTGGDFVHLGGRLVLVRAQAALSQHEGDDSV